MTDKELLKLAAKAAGIKVFKSPDGIFRDCTGFDPMMNIYAAKAWNPLIDDGDALRLAVQLKMHVLIGNEGIRIKAPNLGFQFGMPIDDAMTSVRQAIVQAAAEIGKAMQ